MKGNGKPPRLTLRPVQPLTQAESKPGIVIECEELRGVTKVEFSIHSHQQMKVRGISREEEVSDGAAFANYKRKGELLGIELLAPCDTTVLAKIAPDTTVRRFIRNGIPRQMALAGA